MQIIVNRELEPMENRYLRSLRNEVDEHTARMLREELNKYKSLQPV